MYLGSCWHLPQIFLPVILGALRNHKSLVCHCFPPRDGPELPGGLFFESPLQIASCPCLSVAQKNVCFPKEDMGREVRRSTQPSDGVKSLEKWDWLPVFSHQQGVLRPRSLVAFKFPEYSGAAPASTT